MNPRNPTGSPKTWAITHLERALKQMLVKLTELQRQREGIAQKLSALDKEIARIKGSSVAKSLTGSGKRYANSKGLFATMRDVMSPGKKMSVGDITQAVLATGYRSASSNFRGIVNQTLIMNRKVFKPVKGMRGFYTRASA
jgi:conjugal transfer/entry exclusion protein